MKRVFIYFKEKLSNGRCLSREKQIAISLDIPIQMLDFCNMRSLSEKTVFRSYRDKRYPKLKQLLEEWNHTGIDAAIIQQFDSPGGWEKWKKNVFFNSLQVHWQVVIEHDDGFCTVYVDLGLAFSPELERIYKLAVKMKPKPGK